MKQTAVEWLVEELFKTIDYIQVNPKLIEQAKAMEKEQIVDAFGVGRLHQKGLKDDLSLSFHNGVKFGAQWQADRMYSEEDMREAFIACWKANVPDGIECKVSFNEWFEQFKKK